MNVETKPAPVESVVIHHHYQMGFVDNRTPEERLRSDVAIAENNARYYQERYNKLVASAVLLYVLCAYLLYRYFCGGRE